MDLDKFRSRWDDPEFRQSLAGPDPEPVSAIIERMKRRDRLERRKRIARRVMVRVPFAIVLGLFGFKLLVQESREMPMQVVAFILEAAVIYALNQLDKAREKYGQPKMWLPHKEFLLDEDGRLEKIIRFDRWNSVMVCLAIIGLAVYAAPFLSAGLQNALWLVTAAVVPALLIYDLRKISQLRQEKDIVAAQLKEIATTDSTDTAQ